MPEKITLHEIDAVEFENLIRKIIKEEFVDIDIKVQRAMGEDDLISIGTVCRLLGCSSKVVKPLIDQGYFTVYNHLKERRFKRSEILDYVNKYRTNKKRG